ncbi:uncharacterized protein METZ01_LOCUS369072 [marine metagenome]|uniref:Uncharacterized protein n=1 Tax=marine metagenome TaxID=408172 RepID=A0A382T4B1_9ZZZZ
MDDQLPHRQLQGFQLLRLFALHKVSLIEPSAEL